MRGRRRLSRALWFPSPAHRYAFAGTYVALVCPNNDTTAPCQLNAHVIAMVAPESILHGLRVGASRLEGNVYGREFAGVVGGGGRADPHVRGGVGDDGSVVLDERGLAGCAVGETLLHSSA